MVTPEIHIEGRHDEHRRPVDSVLEPAGL